MEQLLTNAGLQVQREPLILGKTPDLLVSRPPSHPFIVECIARLPVPSHAEEIAQYGYHFCQGNIADIHQNLYSRLEHKATKYRHIAATMPYVISLYDATCMNSVEAAFDLALSPYAPTVSRDPHGNITGKHYNTLWRTPAIPAALFELYPHLSGLLYSRWPNEHYYLPNPFAERPILPDPFQFAAVPATPPNYPIAWQPRPATITAQSPPPPQHWLPQLEATNDPHLHQLAIAAD